jgi:hypothetical protein
MSKPPLHAMTKTWYVSFPTLAHSNSPLEGLDYILHPLLRHTMSEPQLHVWGWYFFRLPLFDYLNQTNPPNHLILKHIFYATH